MPSKKPEVVGSGPINFPKISFNVPGRAAWIGGILLALVVLVVIVFNACFTYIHPNELGIKQVNVGVFTSRGIQEEVYGPGLAFRMPFGFETIHRLPQHVQVLDLTFKPSEDLPSYHHDQVAKIQTSDGFYVDVDVSILYQITDPYRVVKTLGPDQQYLYQGILPKAEPILKQALGALTTEDFYNSPLRVERANMARDLLHEELESKGMEVDQVLVRYFRYSDEIQKNIEEKKLQDQMVFKNQSEARAAKEEARLKQIIQEGEAAVRVTLEEGQAYRVEKEAERDLYVRRQRAEADLLVELAEAKRTELRNAAMQSLGAERAVALKMAEVLQGLETIIVPVGGDTGINALDLDQVVNLFGGLGESAPAAETTKPSELISSDPVKELLGNDETEEESTNE